MFLFRLPPRPGKLRPSRAHRCKFAAFSAGQKAGWRSCDPLRFQSGPQIHHSKFKIQNYELGAQPAALFRVQIQNSKFKITHSGRSLRSTHVRIRTAGLRRREAAGCCAHSGANSEFNIQNSKSRARAAACGEAVQSGPMGRELRASAPPGCGPPTSNEAECTAKSINNCGPPIPAGSISLSRPARSRADGPARADLRDASMQPSARGRLRAAAPQRAQIQYSIFNIQNYALGVQPSEEPLEAALRDASCGPPPPPRLRPARS